MFEETRVSYSLPKPAPALQASCTYSQAALTTKRTIVYLRVSTARQGASGLGLEAQREAVARYLGDQGPIAVYTETESGTKNDRPQLRQAIDHCRRTNARLIVAKLDRLSRNAKFLLTLIDSDVEISFADMPQLSGPQGRFLLTSMAAVAQLERDMISQRTRDALQAAKRRGVKLGNPRGAAAFKGRQAVGAQRSGEVARWQADARAEIWAGVFSDMAGRSLSLNAMARELNDRGETTSRGAKWTAKACSRMLSRLSLQPSCPYSQAA